MAQSTCFALPAVAVEVSMHMLSSEKFKFVARLVMAALIFQSLPSAQAWAQQAGNPPKHVSEPGAPQKAGDPIPRNPIEGAVTFLWQKPGDSPLIPPHLVPKFGKGNDNDDLDSIQAVILGIANLNVGIDEEKAAQAHALFWTGMVIANDGKKLDPHFVEEIKDIARNRSFSKAPIVRGQIFYSPMPFGSKSKDGRWEVVSKGVPIYDDDKPGEMWQSRAIVPKAGPFAGLALALAIPTFCFNGVFNQATLAVAPMPVEPEPKVETVDLEIIKNTTNALRRNIDPPSRMEDPFSFRYTPANGGSPINVELFNDNKKGKLSRPKGERGTVCENPTSARWKALTPCQEVVFGRDKKITFENMQVPDQMTLAAPVPLAPTEKVHTKETKIIERDGSHKKWLIGGGIIAAIATIALFTPRGGKETVTEKVIVPPPKTGSSGGSPAISFGFTFGGSR